MVLIPDGVNAMFGGERPGAGFPGPIFLLKRCRHAAAQPTANPIWVGFKDDRREAAFSKMQGGHQSGQPCTDNHNSFVGALIWGLHNCQLFGLSSRWCAATCDSVLDVDHVLQNLLAEVEVFLAKTIQRDL